MKIPTIHLNGTNGNTLRGEYFKAYMAVDKAMEVLSDVTVHGRDYYVQPEKDAFQRAMEERLKRLETLQNIKNELETIILGIDKQLP